MLIVYLDEFGHVGPYISPKHKKYHENPVFGYGGFVIPEVEVRRFGGYFEHIKERLLAEEIRAANVHPRRWEKKGASLLTTKNYNKYGSEMIPALKRISRELKRSRGNVFFLWAREATRSSEHQLRIDSGARKALFDSNY